MNDTNTPPGASKRDWNKGMPPYGRRDRMIWILADMRNEGLVASACWIYGDFDRREFKAYQAGVSAYLAAPAAERGDPPRLPPLMVRLRVLGNNWDDLLDTYTRIEGYREVDRPVVPVGWAL